MQIEVFCWKYKKDNNVLKMRFRDCLVHLPFKFRSSIPLILFFAMINVSASATNPPPAVPPPKTVKVSIKGRVQGVCFRDWTVRNAQELGLNGWVRNRRDGSVEAVFSGDPEKIQEMVDRRCRVGPPAAMVTALIANPMDEFPDDGFRCKPTV